MTHFTRVVTIDGDRVTLCLPVPPTETPGTRDFDFWAEAAVLAEVRRLCGRRHGTGRLATVRDGVFRWLPGA